MKSLQYPGIRVQQVKDERTRATFLDLDGHIRALYGAFNALVSKDTSKGQMKVEKPVVVPELSTDPRIQSAVGTPGELKRVGDTVFVKAGIAGNDRNWTTLGGARSTAIVSLAQSIGLAKVLAGGADTTIYSYTIPAGVLAVDGDSVEIMAHGQAQYPGTPTNRWRANVGATTTIDTSYVYTWPTGWSITLRIFRTGANSQKVVSWLTTINTTFVETVDTAEPNAGPIVVAIVGNGASLGDIDWRVSTVNFRSAAT